MSNARIMLEVRHVTKRYGAITAVRDVSFTVRPGEVLGYLGPNGSGKSTTVKMLAGLMPPSLGTIHFDGQDIQDDLIAYKAQVGYVPEEAHVYTYLTAPEYLRLCGRLRGIPSATPRAEDRRLPAILGPRHRPPRDAGVVLERHAPEGAALGGAAPQSAGGDPRRTRVGPRRVHRARGSDHRQGARVRQRLIFYSSHELDTVEKISTRVMILRSGQVVADDSAANLRKLMHLASLEDVFSQLAVKDNVEAVAGALLQAVRL